MAVAGDWWLAHGVLLLLNATPCANHQSPTTKPLMSLITELSSDFTKAVRSRGADYFQEGRVRITKGSDWEVQARVRGSRTYRVDLEIEGNELVVHCDCPAFEREPCKHLWATILAVEGTGYLRGDGAKGLLLVVPDFNDDGFYDYGAGDFHG